MSVMSTAYGQANSDEFTHAAWDQQLAIICELLNQVAGGSATPSTLTWHLVATSFLASGTQQIIVAPTLCRVAIVNADPANYNTVNATIGPGAGSAFIQLPAGTSYNIALPNGNNVFDLSTWYISAHIDDVFYTAYA